MKIRIANTNGLMTACKAGLVLAILFLGGCTPEADPFLDLVDSQIGTQQSNDLERTMSLAVSDSSYDYKQYEEKVSGGLNRWIRLELETGGEAADDSAAWTPSPLASGLVEKFRQIPAVAQFDKLEFVSTDPYYIRERSWMKMIADRVCDSQNLSSMELFRLQAGEFTPEAESTTPVYDLFQKLNPEMSFDDVRKLADAVAIFDWLTRNIQLEDPMNIPDAELGDYQLNEGENLSRPEMGVPGLGYRRLGWQILVYGRADYLEKMKLFSGLCRQRGISSAVLMVDDKPWVVAALVGDKAWLFDSRLGSPIPGERPGQVATLSDVQANHDLLKRLDLTVAETNRDDSRYWVQADQLDTVRAEILSPPEAVSRRMKFLEDRLLGDQRLELADNPVRVADELKTIAPGLNVAISPSGFETHQFRRVVGEALKRASFDSVIAQRLSWHYEDEYYIDNFVDYRSVRNLFFVGRFETPRNSRKMSAVEGFYSMMYTDEQITNIGFDTPRLNRLGVIQERGQSATEFERRLAGLQQNMRMVRRDMGIFLAQSHYDNGNISSCGNWLKTLRKRDDTERWIPVMEYLESRADESIRDYDGAIAAYKKSDGPQFLGNNLRARFLREALDAAGLKPVAIEESPKETTTPEVQPEAEKSATESDSPESTSDDDDNKDGPEKTDDGDGGLLP